jgi:hypothetical protein
MVKFLPFLLLPAIAASNTAAQQPVSSGIMKYSVSKTFVNKAGDKVSRIEKRDIYFSDSTLKIVTEFRPSIIQTVLLPCSGNSGKVYLTNTRDFYVIEDQPAKELFDMGHYADAVFKTDYLADSAEINGFKCKKAVMSTVINGDSAAIAIWYTPAILVRPACFPYFFEFLSGLPVRISMWEQPLASMTGTKPQYLEYTLTAFHSGVAGETGMVDHAGKYTDITADPDHLSKMMRVMMSNP